MTKPAGQAAHSASAAERDLGIALLGLLALTCPAQESADHAVVVLLTGGSRPQDLELMPRLKAEGKTGVCSTPRCAPAAATTPSPRAPG